MTEPVSHVDLLPSLGRLTRGLSALFWGLPIALVVCVQTAKGDWFRNFGILPPILATALLSYGVSLLGAFQKQERVWRAALDRALVFSLINLGFSPFLYWWNRMPTNEFYHAVVELMTLSGLLFLFTLNPMLCRLTAMLPDEALRQETRLFTSFNRYLLLLTLLVFALFFVLGRYHALPHLVTNLVFVLNRLGLWLTLFLILLPLAMTMALIWKVKEVILAGVFSPGH